MKKGYLFEKMMALLMVVVMIFAMLPMTAFASTTDENGNVWYGDQLYVDVEAGSEGYTWMSLFRTYAHGYEFSGHFMGDGEGPQTFVMIDTVAHDGTTWTPNGTYNPMYSNYEVTYCCDVETMIKDSTYYKRVNLEDSEYYTDTQAAKIRAIVTNSYPYVSLADMKADLAANGYAYADELTCNDALAAIQVAIWCCANGMSAESLRYAKSYKVSDNLQWGYPLHDTSAQSGLDVSGYRVFKTYEEVGTRIDSLVDYLLAQSSVYADKAQIVITKLEMDCGSVVAGEEKPEVTLNLELNNSGSGYQDNINIDIMVNGEVVETFPVELGKEQYAIKINANREDNIKAVVYGTQVLPAGVYFYAPKPADVDGDGIATSREVSQNLVGVAMGATPVWAEAEILVPEKTKVHVTKVWDDAQNSEGKRPEEITVNLLADGEVIASQNLSDENGWAWTFEDLEVFDGERPIEYSVEEVSVDGYETTIVGSVADGFIITNRMYVHTLGSITVTKVTEGDAATPATATFQLQKQDGEEWINVGEAVAYSAFVDGKYTFSGLTEGTYRVIEDGAEVEEFHLATVDGEIVTLTKTTENNGDTFVSDADTTVTNAYTPYIHELGSITVTKTSTGAATPATATFQLQKQDGEEWINVGEAVAYSAFVDGQYTFSGLTEGTYRVIESGAEVEEFHLVTVDGEIVTLTKTTEENGDTFVSDADTTVTNAYTPYIHELGSITLTKTSTGAATPATATFQLQMLDGENWINVGEAVAYSAFVDGKYTFSGLTEGTYRVIESGAEIEEFHLTTVDGEIVTLTKTTEENGDTFVSEGNTTVTNAYTPYIHELGSITVTKTSTGTATPATATFQLQKQDGENWINVGEAVPYSAFVDGKYTFSDLTEGTYRIIESGAAIAEYRLTTTNSGNVVLTKSYNDGDTYVSDGSIEVTNTYTAYVHTLGSITLTKTSTGAATPATATFQLQKQDGENWINVGEAVPYSAFVDGKYTFSELTEGTYRVLESGADVEGFTLTTTNSGNVVLTKSYNYGDTSVNSGEISLVNEYEEEIIEIPDEDVPEGPAPTDPTEDEEDDEIIEIPEDDVPRADVPNTGDQILPFVGMAIASGAAAIFVGKFGKKEEEV